MIRFLVKSNGAQHVTSGIHPDDHDDLFPVVEPASTLPTPKWVGSKRIRAVQARLRKHTFSVSDKVLMRFVEAVHRRELQDYVDARIRVLQIHFLNVFIQAVSEVCTASMKPTIRHTCVI
jgi:hypothetical protein